MITKETNDKQAIEQQLNHLMENLDRQDHQHMMSSQVFSMLSLSYMLIDLIGKLKREEKSFALSFLGIVQSGLNGHPRNVDVLSAAPLRNHIFDTKLFDSDEKLKALLAEIARSIDLGEYNAIYGTDEHGRINPTAKNEWYYVFEALQEAGVCRKNVGDKEFVEQMMEWFPTVFSNDTPEEMKAMTDKLRKSISRERTLWKYGSAKEVTKLKDMWARRNQLGIAYEKVSRFYEIAYRGLYMRLVGMKEKLNAVK